MEEVKKKHSDILSAPQPDESKYGFVKVTNYCAIYSMPCMLSLASNALHDFALGKCLMVYKLFL